MLLGKVSTKTRGIKLGELAACETHKPKRPNAVRVISRDISALIDAERIGYSVSVGGVKRNEYGLLGRDGRNREYGCDHNPTEL